MPRSALKRSVRVRGDIYVGTLVDLNALARKAPTPETAMRFCDVVDHECLSAQRLIRLAQLGLALVEGDGSSRRFYLSPHGQELLETVELMHPGDLQDRVASKMWKLLRVLAGLHGPWIDTPEWTIAHLAWVVLAHEDPDPRDLGDRASKRLAPSLRWLADHQLVHRTAPVRDHDPTLWAITEAGRDLLQRQDVAALGDLSWPPAP